MASPIRLKAKRTPLLRRQRPEDVENGLVLPANPNRRLSRPLRAVRRFATAMVWTLLGMLVQGLMLIIPGRGKILFARIYWAGMCRILGLRVRSIGRPARKGGEGRPVIFVANHSSWLDILVLGGQLEACFISKEEVGRWPLVSLVARLGRTVFVRRTKASTARERDEMRERLLKGDNLILFPEGTSSDGSRVLPFRSAFFSLADAWTAAKAGNPAAAPPLVQPVSVVYDRLGYLPTGRAMRPIFSWYADMDLGSHAWRLAQFRGLRATVLLHAPLDPRDFPDRKALSQAAWRAVADGAATLRQNRPARPLGAPQVGVEGASTIPAFGM